MANIHEHARAAVFIIHDASFRMRRHYFASLEVPLVIERESRQLRQFLRREEFVEHYRARSQYLGPLCHTDVRLGGHCFGHCMGRLGAGRSGLRLSEWLGWRYWT